jgi:hypothetical protein
MASRLLDHFIQEKKNIFDSADIILLERQPIMGLMKLAETCGWWHGYEDAVFFQHRPTELHL